MSRMLSPSRPNASACAIAWPAAARWPAGIRRGCRRTPSSRRSRRRRWPCPSSTRCGSPSITARSMNAPGSPSSALQTMYFWSAGCLSAIFHFVPVGKPPPPRPRSPARSTMSHNSLGVTSRSTFERPAYPPRATYSSRLAGSTSPQFARTRRVCRAKNGCSSRKGTSSQACSRPSRNCPSGATGNGSAANMTSSSLSTCFSVTREKLTRGRAGQLHVHERLLDAEADAADLQHVGVDLWVGLQVAPDGEQRLAGAGTQAARPGSDEDHRAGEGVAAQAGVPLGRASSGTHRSGGRAGRLQGSPPAGDRAGPARASTRRSTP